jgi:hypothetical protein
MKVEVTWTEHEKKNRTKEFYLVSEEDEEHFISMGFFTHIQFDRVKKDGFVILRESEEQREGVLALSFLHHSLIKEIRTL